MGDELASLSDAELDEIDRRCHAASKPPWESFIEGRDHWGGDSFIRIGSAEDDEPDMYVGRAARGKLLPAPDADLDFIAYARQDLPRLVAEVRRLRAARRWASWSSAGNRPGHRSPAPGHQPPADYEW
jgi:hypothetical protein